MTIEDILKQKVSFCNFCCELRNLPCRNKDKADKCNQNPNKNDTNKTSHLPTQS